MQVALWAVGEAAERARRTADDLVTGARRRARCRRRGAPRRAPAASVPAVVRASDLLVLVLSEAPVGAWGEPSGRGPVGVADPAGPPAPIWRRPRRWWRRRPRPATWRCVAVAPAAVDEPTDRWLTRLAAEHRGDRARAVSSRRRGRGAGRAAALPVQPGDHPGRLRPRPRTPRGPDARRGRGRRPPAPGRAGRRPGVGHGWAKWWARTGPARTSSGTRRSRPGGPGCGTPWSSTCSGR